MQQRVIPGLVLAGIAGRDTLGFARQIDEIRELKLRDWQPRSILKTKQSKVETPAFPRHRRSQSPRRRQGAEILLAPHQTGGCKTPSPCCMDVLDKSLWLNRKKIRSQLRPNSKGRKAASGR